jgi:hypothetical protein
VEIAAIFAEARPQESRRQDQSEDHDLDRYGGQARIAESHEHIMSGRQVNHILGQELGPPEALDDGAGRERRKVRRHFGIGGENAVERAYGDDAQECEQDREADRIGLAEQVEK